MGGTAYDDSANPGQGFSGGGIQMQLANNIQRCTGVKQLNYYLWECPVSHRCERYLQRLDYDEETSFGDAQLNCDKWIKHEKADNAQ